MMKRTIAMLLVLVMAMSIIPVTAGAEGLAQSYLNVPQRYSRGYDYEYNSDYNYIFHNISPFMPTSFCLTKDLCLFLVLVMV